MVLLYALKEWFSLAILMWLTNESSILNVFLIRTKSSSFVTFTFI